MGGVFLVMARAILESLSIEKRGVESWEFENETLEWRYSVETGSGFYSLVCRTV